MGMAERRHGGWAKECQEVSDSRDLYAREGSQCHSFIHS